MSTVDRAGAAAADGAGAADGVAKALGIAYAYLNKRERTVAEVRARLARTGLADEDAEAAIAELVELGALDDARYVRLFVEDKRNLEQWGSERIGRALAEHGIERELAEAALAAAQPEDELARAVEVLARRFPAGVGGDGDPRAGERAFGMLIRKGYDSDLAASAVRSWRRRRAA